LILDKQTIRRVWEWEISQGHYPSSRRTPAVVGLTQLPNPGLPRKRSPGGINPASDQAQFNQFDEHVALPPTRVSQQNQQRAPLSFQDDILPIGPTRSYLNITAPPVYHHHHSSLKSPPLPYPPRPIPNAIIDLDVVMDYCDFSTNQYVRDCLEILRMGGGLDVEKRVRRGETARWRHVYHEQNDDGSIRTISSKPLPDYDPALHTPMDEEAGEQMIKDPSYQPIDVLSVLKSDAYPQKLKELQKQLHNTADLRRKASTRHPSHPTADPTCDIDYPKIFHIFWAGPFTDKPYLALSSFLFTQNLGLHLPLAEPPKGATMTDDEKENFTRRSKFLSAVCRPQMWVWINPGPAAAIPNPNARREMFDDLRDNPWSAPFLHPRFREVIKFKMWNTTEQLDGVPELRDHWRELPLFNSGGVKYGSAPVAPVKSHQHGAPVGENGQVKEPVKIGIVVPEEKAKLADKDGDGQGEAPDVVEEELGRFGNHTRGEAAVAEDMSTPATNSQPDATSSETPPASSSAAPAAKESDDELFQRVGSTSSKGYDRLSVVLSDMARFVLCHRFGGIYLDADTILLRDWEELWGWRGQFAYRWSRLEKYNTAVLRLHRHSAVGSFLFKTALANGLDFHPMTISR
jgi:WD repeat and SOF domain-containing protein 1